MCAYVKSRRHKYEEDEGMEKEETLLWMIAHSGPALLGGCGATINLIT